VNDPGAPRLAEGVETVGYRIERLLGRGGMGEVWEATQLSLDRRVALKVIITDIEMEVGFDERFRTEAQMAARVDHNAVLPVYDHGRLDDGRLFLTMKLVNGQDLGALLAERGPLSVPQAVGILLPIAEALDAAHDAGLIHRDVKPSNVLLEPQGGSWRPYLADFGLAKPHTGHAKRTRTGEVVGTVNYMAPEQARGDRTLDGRVDVYAFGCLLYRAVTGQVPYPRDFDAATMYAHVHDPPPVPSAAMSGIPPELDKVVKRAMEKDVDRRAPSAGALMRWLAQQIEPQSMTAVPAALPDRSPSALRRFAVEVAVLAPLFAIAYLIGASL